MRMSRPVREGRDGVAGWVRNHRLMAKWLDMLMMRYGQTGGTKGQKERKGGSQVRHGWVVGGVAETTRACPEY